MSLLKQQVAEMLQQKPDIGTQELAVQLNQPEGAVIAALPNELVTVLSGQYSEKILADLPSWGDMMVIIEKEGSFFEIKQTFPPGKIGYGYYNLNMTNEVESALYGHLKLENIKSIALVSKPLRGKETHAIVFISHQDNVIFKIYLGRDENGELYTHQKENFKQLLVYTLK
ncbi:heme utilization cystosolic carrier protein HutX [Gallibacterium salpingitidis]|uniref:heme utilization cystosolic carrier protein HutX n=1 Tax=Gallibacterium salpingitidis TaxID=505341 RepID=UPI00266FAB98|nr:heme utilization cystosolic carrier protein HutX [Gallibacterium salpingitidis]WKT00776.1 heme utilization cystosolic carrier protein HutX [Gallibacterium salpingitidis]